MLEQKYLIKGKDNAFNIEVLAKGANEAKFLTEWLVKGAHITDRGVTVDYSIFASPN